MLGGRPDPHLTPETIDREVGLEVVAQRRDAPQRAVLSNSFGFGGQNVSLLIAGEAA